MVYSIKLFVLLVYRVNLYEFQVAMPGFVYLSGNDLIENDPDIVFVSGIDRALIVDYRPHDFQFFNRPGLFPLQKIYHG